MEDYCRSGDYEVIGQVLQCRQREEIVLIEESQLTAAPVCCENSFFVNVAAE